MALGGAWYDDRSPIDPIKIVWTTGFTAAEKVLFPLGGALALCGLLLYARMVRLLRDRYPEKWQDLGSPTILSRATVAWSVVAYLLGTGHQELADPFLDRLAHLWRLAYVLFLIVMVASIYQILRYGP